MAHETQIGMKIEEETKDIKRLCEKLMDSIKHEFEKDMKSVNTEEMGEAIDMIKDLYEAKKCIVEACYYKKILEAMEESEYGEDYDWQGRMGYRGQPRDSMGRYTRRGGRGRRGYEEPMMYDEMYPMEQYRDMDMGSGRMYFADSSGSQGGGRSQSGGQGGGSRGGRGGSSRYGFAYDQYMEKRDQHSKSSPEENSKRIELLNDFIEDLEDMAKTVVRDMSPEEKQVWKIKLNKLTSI